MWAFCAGIGSWSLIVAAVLSVAVPMVPAAPLTSIPIVDAKGGSASPECGNDIQDEAVSLLQTRVRKNAAASRRPDAAQRSHQDNAISAGREVPMSLLEAVALAAQSLTAVGAATGDAAHVRQLHTLGQAEGFTDQVLQRAHERSHLFDTRARRKALVAVVRALDSVGQAGQHGPESHALLEQVLQNGALGVEVHSQALRASASEASTEEGDIAERPPESRSPLLAHADMDDAATTSGSRDFKLGLLELDRIVLKLSEQFGNVDEGTDIA